MKLEIIYQIVYDELKGSMMSKEARTIFASRIANKIFIQQTISNNV